MASSRIHSRNSPTVSPRNGCERVAIERVEDQPADFVGVGIDQRVVDDLVERQIGQDELGGDALALGPRGQPGELVARLLLVGLGEDLAQVGEVKSLAIGSRSTDSWRLPGAAAIERPVRQRDCIERIAVPD